LFLEFVMKTESVKFAADLAAVLRKLSSPRKPVLSPSAVADMLRPDRPTRDTGKKPSANVKRPTVGQ
jgi:hypothetical protein